MKKTTLSVVVLAMSALLWNACTKSEFGKKQDAAEKSRSTAKDINATPENPGNPRDNIGQLHNLYLDTTIIYLDSGYSLPVVAQRMLDKPFTPGSPLSVSDILNLTTGLITDLPNNEANIISGTSYNSATKGYLTSIVHILVTIDSTTYGDTVYYDDVKTKFVALENTIITDPVLSASERNLLLGTAAVARYSLYYWWTDYTGGSQPTPLPCGIGGIGGILSLSFVQRAVRAGVVDCMAWGQSGDIDATYIASAVYDDLTNP
jgi:hypothetical protein